MLKKNLKEEKTAGNETAARRVSLQFVKVYPPSPPPLFSILFNILREMFANTVRVM